MAAHLSLNEIVSLMVNPFFRRPDSPRASIPEPKPKVGIFGGPGEGKTVLLSAVTSKDYFLYDGMPHPETVRSNLEIKYTWTIQDELAREFGLPKGGDIVRQALPFEKKKMYRMDPEYRNGAYALDEINIELADSLKFNTNANFYFNQADQQLRKDRMGLVYTSIHEMWVDPRLREITDIMVKCYDTALSPEGIAARKPRGEQIEFWVYPMSRYLNGRTWVDHGEKLGPFYLQAKRFWGAIDTNRRQSTGQKYAKSHKELIGDEINPDIEVGENQVANNEFLKWGWLYQIIQDLHDDNVEEIYASDLWDYIGRDRVKEYGMSAIGAQLSLMGIGRRGYGNRASPLRYVISSFDISKYPYEESSKRITGT